MKHKRVFFIPIFFLLVSGCSSVPRLSNLENWSLDDFSSSTRDFRQNWVSPYIGEEADRTINPNHVLRATDILELHCVLGGKLTVSGVYYKNAGGAEDKIKFQEGQVVRLPLSVVADFHKLALECGGSMFKPSLCKSSDESPCVTHLQTSTWTRLSEKFEESIVHAKLLVRDDPVLAAFDKVLVNRTYAADVDDFRFGPLWSSEIVEVSENGLLSIPVPNLTPGKFGELIGIPVQRYWANEVTSTLFALPVVPSGSCEADRVRLSTIQACLNWASGGKDAIPDDLKTPSMKFRVHKCESLAINKDFRPLFDELLASWRLDLQDSIVSLYSENGESINLPLTDGAALVPAVSKAYRLATGRELIEPRSLTRSKAYLTVQPKLGTCQENSAPFYIRVAESQSQTYRPIRLVRGDTIWVSRYRPKLIH